MASINIQQYYKLAEDIKAFKKRDHHLIAEQCLDVYPLYSAGVRGMVRRLIVEHLNNYGVIKMTNQESCEYYDSHPNITLAELSAITGKSVKQLKRILMGEA